jgi:hypothetical protein
VLTAKKSIRIQVGSVCRAQAPNHVTQNFTVPAKRNHRVKLKPVGLLSVRVHPPASRIWIDGQEIDNPSHRISLQGEEHVLLIRYYDQQGQKDEKSKKISIKTGKKLRLYLDMTHK